MSLSKQLKHRLVLAVILFLISFFSLVTVTFAWYVYQTGARTADVHMAVGTGNSLQISNQYDGEYGYSALLEQFPGRLIPVSTNRITGGFQKVTGFTEATEEHPKRLASIFEVSDRNDFYKTSLFLRLNGATQKIYLSDIGYEDADEENPISTAIRVGLVIHEPGQNGKVSAEYIFAINTAENPEAEYNTATGKEGYVLDCTKRDGSTIPMENLYTDEQFCSYDRTTGAVSLKTTSLPLFELSGREDGGFGLPVQVDVYIWLEGCDKDCTNNLCEAMLKNISLSFAGRAD
ncbi:MAG: hypothetical protein SPI28_08610 [Acetatifactor sp.]|nr:hypothetical protein [Acetatifactor sp.]